jgi:hypothetical protein
MTGNYSKIENKYIQGFNSGNDSVHDSVEECKMACNKNPRCLSFEIWPEGGKLKCTTGLVTYDMINSVDPTKLGMDGSYDLYSKTCY